MIVGMKRPVRPTAPTVRKNRLATSTLCCLVRLASLASISNDLLKSLGQGCGGGGATLGTEIVSGIFKPFLAQTLQG